MVIAGECFSELGELLTRYYIYHREKAEGRRIARTYLHHIHRSDAKDVWHDHPWSFISIVLWRGYVEFTPTGRKRIWPGMVIYRPAAWKHRLELTRPAITLVFAFGRSKEWGFFVGNSEKRIPWRQYDYRSGRCE